MDEQSNVFGKLLIIIKHNAKRVKYFFLKLLPNYLEIQQRNLDVRTQDEIPFIIHQSKRVKPGKDYFTANFFSLLMILFFNLFWYRSVVGE